jgi:NitT/TauT family transport system substrate-binding protein
MKLLISLLSLIALAGCAKKNAPVSSDPAAPAAPFKITVQLDWVAEPEHGGFYQAQAKGYFKNEGLDVDLIPGGPNAFVMQKLATGQADIGQADSTTVLLAVAQDIPVIQIGAVFQNDPSVLMLHDENPVKSFADLNGKTVMARPEWAFLPYLKKKYGIDFQLVPQNFSVANFIADKNLIQQGFYIAEPYHITRGGGQMPRFLYAWDAGFDAYTVLAANKTWAAKHPDQARAFMRAYIHGWLDYLAGDPTPAHELLKKVNPVNSDEFMMFSRKMIIDGELVTGRGPGAGADNIGRITKERFATQIQQLEDLGILPKGKVTVPQAMTTDYLP